MCSQSTLTCMKVQNNHMCITIHCLPSWRVAFCFTGPWINHIFHPSILSSIMHFFFWVRPSMIILVTDWVSEQMRPWLHHFFLYSETLALLSSLAPLPSPLPPPSFPSPSLCSYPIQRLLFISPQSSQSSQDSQPANQRGTQLQRMYCSPSTGVWKERHERHSKAQPLSSLLWLIVSPSLLLLGTNLP